MARRLDVLSLTLIPSSWTFLADSIEDFVEQRGLEPEEGTVLPLGFTFSYPATQEYVDQGVLQTWTKGWDIKGVEGHDVAQQLRQALERRVRFPPYIAAIGIR
jgi:hexokinase